MLAFVYFHLYWVMPDFQSGSSNLCSLHRYIQKFLLIHILGNAQCYQTSNFCQISDIKQCIIVALNCISLVTNGIEYLFIYLFTFMVPFLCNSYSHLFSFRLGLSFPAMHRSYMCILRYESLLVICCRYLLPSSVLSFFFLWCLSFNVI